MQHAGSSVAAYEIRFPDQGSNLGSLLWEHAVFATGPPGKSLWYLLKSLKSWQQWAYMFPSGNMVTTPRCVCVCVQRETGLPAPPALPHSSPLGIPCTHCSKTTILSWCYIPKVVHFELSAVSFFSPAVPFLAGS